MITSFGNSVCLALFSGLLIGLSLIGWTREFMFRSFFIFLISSAVGTIDLAAQSNNYFSRSYDVNDGLPQNGVTHIAKDFNGFIWMATGGGVVRWDGRTFKRPDVADVQEIGSLIKRDYLGNLYIVGGENVYQITSQSGLRKVTERADSSLFFSYDGDIVFHTLGKTALKQKYPNLTTIFPAPDGVIRRVLADHEGCYYLTKGDTTIYITPDSAKLLRIKKDPGISFILNSSLVYLCKSGHYDVYVKGELVYQGIQRTIAARSNKIPRRARGPYNPKQAVVGFDDVLYELKLDEKYALTISSSFQLRDTEQAQSFYYDPENGIEIQGEYNTGFKIFRRQQIKQSRVFSDSEKNNIYSISDLNGSTITDREIFYKIYKNSPWNYSFAGPLLSLSNDSLLYVNQEMIFLLDKRDFQVLKRWPVGDRGRVRDLVRLDSLVYFASNELSFCNILTGELTRFPPEGFPSFGKVVRSIAASYKEGHIYAVIGQDLYELNLKQKTRSLLAKNVLGSRSDRRVNLYPDLKRRRLFLVVEGRNVRVLMENNQLIQLPIDPDYALTRCNHVVTDHDGDYWLATNNGLLLLMADDFQKLASNKIVNLKYRKFGAPEGIANEEFNGGFTGAGVLKGDSVLLASALGVVRFHSDIKKERPQTTEKLVLDKIAIDDSVQILGEGYILPPDFKRFEVDISRSFLNGYNDKLVYTIDGTNDTSWLFVAPDGKLVVRNLPAGEYKLRIRDDDMDSDNEIAVEIKVNQYWYKQTANIAGFVLLVLSLAMAGYFQRVRLLRQRLQFENLMNKERLRSLRQQINPHFLQNIFSFLAIEAEMGSAGTRVVGYVRKIATFYREILVSTDKVKFRLEEELDLLEKYLSIQSDIARTRFKFEIRIGENVDVFGVEVPALLLQPLVENILKHAFDKETVDAQIFIEVTQEGDNYVICTIRDNGKGYNENKISEHSMGNKITVERLQLAYKGFYHRPVFELKSRPGAGTTVTVKIPVV